MSEAATPADWHTIAAIVGLFVIASGALIVFVRHQSRPDTSRRT